MRVGAWWTLACLHVLSHADMGGALRSPGRGPEDGFSRPDAFEVHQILLTVTESTSLGRPETEQHLRARQGLLQRMSRKHGTWNEHHPRYRLLEALRGYSAYAQTHEAELNRLKSLYGHVSKQQKAVRRGEAPLPSHDTN